MWDSFSKLGIVVWPWQERATGTYDTTPYLKAMIRNAIMRKMEIPGIVSGLGLIIGTIVLMLYTFH